MIPAPSSAPVQACQITLERIEAAMRSTTPSAFFRLTSPRSRGLPPPSSSTVRPQNNGTGTPCSTGLELAHCLDRRTLRGHPIEAGSPTGPDRLMRPDEGRNMGMSRSNVRRLKRLKRLGGPPQLITKGTRSAWSRNRAREFVYLHQCTAATCVRPAKDFSNAHPAWLGSSAPGPSRAGAPCRPPRPPSP